MCWHRHMTALTDIQKALNTIRRITQQEVGAVRLEALALMAGIMADEAKDIEKKENPSLSVQQRKG
jgi:ubiquinone/menaquinone biosynthesis C-methylase UbiE